MSIQILSIVGMLSIIGSYLDSTAKNKRKEWQHYLTDFIGGIFLFFAAIALNNIGFSILECFWCVISFVGFLRSKGWWFNVR